MIGQKVKNFNLGSLKKTKVTASSGLILLMSFAKEIGLAAELEKRLSHLKKRKRGYCVSEKILSFVEMLIKGGRRLNDIDILSSDPGLLDWNSPEKMDTLKSLSCILIILQRAFLIQGRVSSLSVVKDFNILKDGPSGLIFAVKSY